MLLVALPYLWLAHYVVGTVLGVRADPIVGGDWLTVVFTTWALFSSLALAHRILRIGLDGMTEHSLIDAVVLTWLTAFYFVWMVAREPVEESTTTAELYGPVLAGDPTAQRWALIAIGTAAIAVGIVVRPNPESKLFASPFRTTLVTVPAFVTATVLVLDPGPNSIVWPFVGGVFLGQLGAGVARIQPIASSVAKGAFAVASLSVWTVGALAWLLVYRRRPPNAHVILGHVDFGRGAAGPGDDEPGND